MPYARQHNYLYADLEVIIVYFNLNSEHYEDIRVNIAESEFQDGLPAIINEFCFAMASFFTTFAMKIDCDTEQATSLKTICLSCIGRNIDAILEAGVLEKDDSVVSAGEIDALTQGMQDAGFSVSEIQNIVESVKNCGNLDKANKELMRIGEEAGIDWTSVLRNQE